MSIDEKGSQVGVNQPEQAPVPQKPNIVVILSSSYQEADLKLERVSTATAMPTLSDIMDAIAEKGVVYGLKHDTIQKICDRPIFNVPYTIARGVYPQTGKDGYLKYLVETSKDLKPKLREDNTVDFRDLGFVRNVRKGEVLCEIYPPENGVDGSDVYGNILEGPAGQIVQPPIGKNTELSPEGNSVISVCDGNVDVTNGIISVSDVMKITGNVDNSTGDINFVGDIVIIGDVLSGFNVTSEGSIVIEGTIEGAKVTATHDITVKRGINGMERGVVTAGGSIRCTFMQSCKIRAGQNIYADSIIHCMVECGGDVELNGKRGILIGGRANITGKLSAKSIGTDSNIMTGITMCSPNVQKEQQVQMLKKQLHDLDSEQLKLTQIVNFYTDLKKNGKLDKEKEATIPIILQNLKRAIKSKEIAVVELAEVEQEQLKQSMNNSYVKCSGAIYPGTKFMFGPVSLQVSTQMNNIRVFLDSGEVKWAGL